VDVDRPVEGLEVLAPHQVHEGLAREHPARPLGEGHQQGELVGGEASLRPVQPHGPRVAIDLEPAEAQGGGRARPVGPAQDRAQPREQLPGLERLRQVVVGAYLEPDHAVHRVAPRGQHEHRGVGEGP